MDRDAQVRATRRRQALDALAFERDRAALLIEQLEETVASIEGARVDADLDAQLSPDDALLVRAALHLGNPDDVHGSEDEESDEYEEEGEEEEGEEGEEDQHEEEEDEDEDEQEIVRLQGELDSSGKLQAALERYLDLL